MNIKSLHRPVMTAFAVLGFLAIVFTSMPLTANAAYAFNYGKPVLTVVKAKPIQSKPTVYKPMGGGGLYRIVPGYTTPGYRPYGSKK